MIKARNTMDFIIVSIMTFAQIACGGICLLLLGVMGTLVFSAAAGCNERQLTPPVVIPSAPPAISQPSTPSPSSDPPPSLVDFEDMSGLDVATQELLNERYRDIGPADFEKRLRRLEWAVSALSDRVFGRSVLSGESGAAGIGDAGTGQDAIDNE